MDIVALLEKTYAITGPQIDKSNGGPIYNITRANVYTGAELIEQLKQASNAIKLYQAVIDNLTATLCTGEEPDRAACGSMGYTPINQPEKE